MYCSCDILLTVKFIFKCVKFIRHTRSIKKEEEEKKKKKRTKKDKKMAFINNLAV